MQSYDVTIVGGCGRVGLPLAVLRLEATTSLDETLDEVVPWVVDAVGRGLI